jgi:hypothetical protein
MAQKTELKEDPELTKALTQALKLKIYYQ